MVFAQDKNLNLLKDFILDKSIAVFVGYTSPRKKHFVHAATESIASK